MALLCCFCGLRLGNIHSSRSRLSGIRLLSGFPRAALTNPPWPRTGSGRGQAADIHLPSRVWPIPAAGGVQGASGPAFRRYVARRHLPGANLQIFWGQPSWAHPCSQGARLTVYNVLHAKIEQAQTKNPDASFSCALAKMFTTGMVVSRHVLGQMVRQTAINALRCVAVSSLFSFFLLGTRRSSLRFFISKQ